MPGLPFSRNALTAFASLSFASVVCVALVVARIYRTGSLNYVFLVWNLILAWVPLVYAFIAYRIHKSRIRNVLLIGGCALVWLLFLPNAPYILTDLLHLRVESNHLFWFDLLMLLWFAWTGFLLGFVSLHLMQSIVADSFGPVVGWPFAIVSLGLSSFGVFLGRFLRWNSWDILRDPFALFADIYHVFRHPFANFYTHAFWIILAAFLISVYVTLTTLTPLNHEQRAN